jgi:hypothetical protein
MCAIKTKEENDEERNNDGIMDGRDEIYAIILFHLFFF